MNHFHYILDKSFIQYFWSFQNFCDKCKPWSQLNFHLSKLHPTGRLKKVLQEIIFAFLHSFKICYIYNRKKHHNWVYWIKFSVIVHRFTSKAASFHWRFSSSSFNTCGAPSWLCRPSLREAMLVASASTLALVPEETKQFTRLLPTKLV